MFAKKDYHGFFKQLYTLEIEMEEVIRGVERHVHCAEAKVILKRIRQDEIRHAKIVKRLMTLVK